MRLGVTMLMVNAKNNNQTTSPMKNKEKQLSNANNFRLPATPGTSGRPRSSPKKAPLAQKQQKPTLFSKSSSTFWERCQNHAETLKAFSLKHHDAHETCARRSREIQEKAKTKFAEARVRSGEFQEKMKPKAAEARARSRELQEKAKTKFAEAKARSGQFQEKAKASAGALSLKTKDRAHSLRAWVESKAAEAKLWFCEEILPEAQAYLNGWLEEIREVGHWNHPAPWILGVSLTLVFIFLSCSLCSTWSVTTRAIVPHQHLAQTDDAATIDAIRGDLKDSEHFVEGISESTVFSETMEEVYDEEDTTIYPRRPSAVNILKPAAPVPETVEELLASRVDPPLRRPTVFQKQYEENTQRYLKARAALQEHQFAEAHQILAELANDQGFLQRTEGTHQFDRVVGNFSRGDYLADLGTTFAFAGQYHEAVNLLGAGINYMGGRPRGSALNALGIAYRNLGDYDSAHWAFQTAAHFAPKNPKVWSNLGVLAMEQGNYQEADDAFYYAAEAYGPNNHWAIRDDEILINNVKILQNRALGLVEQDPNSREVATLELWYDQEEE